MTRRFPRNQTVAAVCLQELTGCAGNAYRLAGNRVAMTLLEGLSWKTQNYHTFRRWPRFVWKVCFLTVSVWFTGSNFLDAKSEHGKGFGQMDARKMWPAARRKCVRAHASACKKVCGGIHGARAVACRLGEKRVRRHVIGRPKIGRSVSPRGLVCARAKVAGAMQSMRLRGSARAACARA